MALGAMHVLNLPDFENKKYTADDRFHGNSRYGEILTKKEPIRTLGFTFPYNKYRFLALRKAIFPPSLISIALFYICNIPKTKL